LSSASPPRANSLLTVEVAAALARVALANVQREFPRRLDQLILSAADEHLPRRLHPAFYGSYDWHSAVHMHWLLVRALRLFPSLPGITQVLDAHLSVGNIARELAFFQGPGGSTFERPYGWAWLLKLQAEALRVGRWSDALTPLAAEIAGRFHTWLTATPYPVRAGAHGNTAFACILALDYARTSKHPGLQNAIGDAARRWYGTDRSAPVKYEPSADDFLSPTLVEALLMQEISAGAEWLQRFLPADLGPLAEPPHVVDHADAKQSHLDGLCLSRAWCFARLGYEKLAAKHLEAGMPHVSGGDYVGEHWLASFAMLAFTDR
jgi:hypothetical protein